MIGPDRISRLIVRVSRTGRYLHGLALIVAVGAVGAPGANAFEVAAAGDVACPPWAHSGDRHGWNVPEEFKCRGRAIADLIDSRDPRLTIAAGDLIHGDNAKRSAYREFSHEWKPLRGEIMPTPGNHDRKQAADDNWNFDGYFSYWYSKGLTRSRIGRPNRSWASYDVGTWHMVNLNSNCNTVNCTLTGPQIRWLLRDLKKDRENPETKCLLAYMHHPRFSAGVARGRTGDRMLVSNLWEVLYRYRADILVTGHQHYYERYRPLNPGGMPDPTGITQYITGTGGAIARTPYSSVDVSAAGAQASIRSLGATFFQLGRNSYTSSFRTIKDNRRDRLATPVRCHGQHVGASRRKRRTNRFLNRVRRLKRLERKRDAGIRKVRKLRRKKSRLARNANVRYSTRTTLKQDRNSDRLDQAREDLERTRQILVRLLNKPLYS